MLSEFHYLKRNCPTLEYKVTIEPKTMIAIGENDVLLRARVLKLVLFCFVLIFVISSSSIFTFISMFCVCHVVHEELTLSARTMLQPLKERLRVVTTCIGINIFPYIKDFSRVALSPSFSHSSHSSCSELYGLRNVLNQQETVHIASLQSESVSGSHVRRHRWRLIETRNQYKPASFTACCSDFSCLL